MNDHLSCALVRDLLPVYLEKLTSEETNEALRNHLAACPACTAALEAMRTGPEAEAAERPREVDYLKQVKRRNRNRVLLAVLATAAGLLAALLLKVFVIGTPLQAQTLAVMDVETIDVQEDYGRLRLKLASVASANAYHGWNVETVDGIASIYAREVLASPLFHSGDAMVYVPLEGVREVWLGGKSGKLVWQDGTVISQLALELLDGKTPYCGDPSALGRIARLLRIPEHLGEYTVSMQTSRPPYSWTLHFSHSLSEAQQEKMARFAGVMLALVDNLDEVSYTWPDPAGGGLAGGSSVVFRDGAARRLAEWTERHNALHGTDWTAKDRIKEYTETPAEFQHLLDLLELP